MALRTIRNLAFGVLIGVPTVLPMAAAADDSKPREAVIMVSGEGQSAVAPDMAVLSLAVVKQAKTARDDPLFLDSRSLTRTAFHER